MNPLILPFLKEVLHAVMETELVSTWLDHLTEGTPTKLDDMFLEFVRNILGVEDRAERDRLVTEKVADLQRIYNEATPDVRASLKSPAPMIYAMADLPGLIGFGSVADSTG